MSLLEVKNLKVHFPVTRGIFKRDKRVVHAVDGVSFDINESETLGLVGESGCGKTTTGRSIVKLLKATSGSIFFDGEDILPLKRKQLIHFRKKCQIVFQNPYSSLDPRMTIGSILSEPLKSLTSMSRRERTDRVAALLNEVNLSPKFLNRYPHEFSGGQRQRINIARALSVSPKLIVADEPVSALDVSIQAQIINLLQDLQAKFKMAYLFIAHDLSVVKTLSHRVAVMYLGKIVEIAPTKTLYAEPMHPYTKALMSAVPIPDPKKERLRKRMVVSGEIPSPIDLPSGCTFHPRCPFAKERCRAVVPILRKLPNGSHASCHFAEELMGK
ncbi:MAG: oligopeptide/dipeptide transporter, ATPase subunit [Bacteriovoracaceae bacterium]|nr:oligopeptide/dipeptide transporter, ATPase subunit [Bacteriovoracaceae bacterium]